jgi:hypothetical protein
MATTVCLCTLLLWNMNKLDICISSRLSQSVRPRNNPVSRAEDHMVSDARTPGWSTSAITIVAKCLDVAATPPGSQLRKAYIS